MKYAICQTTITAGDPKANRTKLDHWIRTTAQTEQPDVIVLPEMWNTGYALSELEQIADKANEPSQSFLSKLAKTYHINIIGGSIGNYKNGKYYNTSLVFNRAGELVYAYDKIHLVPMLDEPHYLTGGEQQVQTFELDNVKMGLIICYDLRFPELARMLALSGAEILHVVAEWPAPRRDHWQILQTARAIENQQFVITCNAVGSYNGTTYAGESRIIDPWGQTLQSGSETEEETITATLDLQAVNKIRQDVPIYESRVPNLYTP